VSADEQDHRSRQPRPPQLLASPEPITMIAPVPDGPPVLFRGRHTRYLVATAEGPERIAPEWWLLDGGHDPEQLARIRDYYRVEDVDGLRFWIFREGLYRPDRPPCWYLHGMFG
jgi:protein ImuB